MVFQPARRPAAGRKLIRRRFRAPESGTGEVRAPEVGAGEIGTSVTEDRPRSLSAESGARRLAEARVAVNRREADLEAAFTPKQRAAVRDRLEDISEAGR